MQRVRTRWVYDFRRTAHAAFDQVSMERAVLPDCDLMFFALEHPSNRHVTRLSFLGDTRR